MIAISTRVLFVAATLGALVISSPAFPQRPPLKGGVEKTELPADEFAAGGECGPGAPYGARGDCSMLKSYVDGGGRDPNCIALRRKAIRLSGQIDALGSRSENTKPGATERQGKLIDELKPVRLRLEQDCPLPTLRAIGPKLDHRGDTLKGKTQENVARLDTGYAPPRPQPVPGWKIGSTSVDGFPVVVKIKNSHRTNEPVDIDLDPPNRSDGQVLKSDPSAAYVHVWGIVLRNPAGDSYVITRLRRRNGQMLRGLKERVQLLDP